MFPTMLQTETSVARQDTATVTGLLSSAFQSPSLRHSLISSSMTQVLPLLVFPPAHLLQQTQLQQCPVEVYCLQSKMLKIILNHQLSFGSLVYSTWVLPGVAFCISLQHRSSQDTTESDGAKLRFPTHRGISGRFCLRHTLLHLPSTSSWFYLLL